MNQNIFIYKTHNGAKNLLKLHLITNSNWDQPWTFQPRGSVPKCQQCEKINVPMSKHPWYHNITAPKFPSAVTSLCHMSAKPKHTWTRNVHGDKMSTEMLFAKVPGAKSQIREQMSGPEIS